MSTTSTRRTDRRARRFARLWAAMDAKVDEQFRSTKSALLTDIPDQVVEIGAGRGSTFGYLPRGTRVVAVEPNTFMHGDLRTAAAEHGIDVEIVAGDLASAGLAAESQGLVVSNLVLCSVADIDAVLAEVIRILRPGGRMVFIEHVAAPPGSARAAYQWLVRRAWRALGDGCDPRSQARERLHRSGLEVTDARLEGFGSRLDPTHLVYWGTARRPVRP